MYVQGEGGEGGGRGGGGRGVKGGGTHSRIWMDYYFILFFAGVVVLNSCVYSHWLCDSVTRSLLQRFD